MKFCSRCGSDRIELRIPTATTFPASSARRARRSITGESKIVVGTLPEWEDRILLCRRAIEPRHGLWTLPAGFLENNETIFAGALRETLEEASARVEIGSLYSTISLPQISQVYMIFRARLLDLDFGPGPESLDVRLFEEHEVPWEDLAFRTIGRTLRNYFLDRKQGAFPTRVSSLIRKALGLTSAERLECAPRSDKGNLVGLHGDLHRIELGIPSGGNNAHLDV